MLSIRRNLRLAALLALPFASACGGDLEVVRPEPGVTDQALSDPQILDVTAAANQGEIDQGALAVRRAVSTSARGFAQRVIDDHTAALAEGNALAARIGLTPEESALSRALVATSAATLETLEDLDGMAFDRAYLDAQINQHAEVLAILDDRLLVDVDDADLQAMLEAMRPVVAEHLDMAEQLVDALDGAPATPIN